MSDMAKKARAAMKAKASKMTTADPHQKVDSSTWTPPDPLNTEVKTGLRPISRRAFKSGGKVMGVKAKMNLGKSTRGGNKPLTPDNFANKDVKAANEDRAGLKHIGGMKKGGRIKKQVAGAVSGNDEIANLIERDNLERSPSASAAGMEKMPLPVPRPKNLGKPERFKSKYDLNTQSEKRGGKVRAKKMLGGPMMNPMNPADVKDKAMEFQGNPVTPGLKKGGAAKHDDAKQDMALIKKMVKPEARKGRYSGGGVFSGPGYPGKVPGVTGGRIAHATRGRVKSADDLAAEYAMRGPDEAMQSIVHGGIPPHLAKAFALQAARDADIRAMQDMQDMPMSSPAMNSSSMGGADMPRSYMREMDSMYNADMPRRNGGRAARRTGGATKGKGKTNINIIIAGGKPAGQQGMMNPGDIGPTPPPGMDQGPGGRPIPIPAMPPGGGAGAAAPMPMPYPIPMPMGGGGGGQPPMARKAGGRITKVASSYKDMEAGSAGGEGRLQKTDIAKKHKDAPAFKKGGKVYRSYKDMDAGSASGLGRLEKTEIQARKG